MLHTQESWEEVRSTSKIAAIFNQPGLRRFRCVEAAQNNFLFHVDIAQNSGDYKLWSRLILDDFSCVAELLSMPSAGTIRLSLQTPRIDNQDYKMIAIKEIVAISEGEDDIQLCLIGTDDRRYPLSYWDDEFFLEAGQSKSIWSASPQQGAP